MKTETFEKLIEAAKKNKKGLLRLKEAVVSLQQYELASELREIELKAFPQTKQVKDAKAKAKAINLLFSMVGLNVSEDICWLVYEAIKMYDKKRGNPTTKDAVALMLKKEEIFL
jgi:hypothetical protein